MYAHSASHAHSSKFIRIAASLPTLQKLEPLCTAPSPLHLQDSKPHGDAAHLASQWLSTSSGAKKILWLSGSDDIELSQITADLVSIYTHLGYHGGHISSANLSEDKDDAGAGLIKSLAAQLATVSPEIAQLLSAVIESHPEVLDLDMYSQFEELILGPLSALDATASHGPLLIALNLAHELGTTVSGNSLLDLLVRQVLPPFVRMLVSSNTTDHLDGLLSGPEVLPYNLDLDNISLNSSSSSSGSCRDSTGSKASTAGKQRASGARVSFALVVDPPRKD